MTSATTENLALFKTICADFEDILPQDLHGPFSKHLHRPYLSLITTNNNNDQSSSPTTVIAHQKHVQGIVWGASLRLVISLPVQITDAILTLSGTRFPINVHFLYLPASPQTYLSEEALRTLGIEDMVIVGEHSIASPTTPLDPPTTTLNNSNNNNNNNNCNNNFTDNSTDDFTDNMANNGLDGCIDGIGADIGGYGSSSYSLLRLPLRINGYPIMVARSPSDGHFSHLNILGQDFIQLSGANVFFGGQIPRFEISFR
ncbi:hypothetical protein BGX29_004366 [Mortierella sp. GBA35]|nr:hypothetical protein BGX23_003857 [Mortierella sp. AD031]KAF9102631.1 hypothetical protein BGX29_004366 [Mortierella sp. GBA35]KAG0218393.1 hypothetical protein BGX33_007535 [Mortierella sp. NVP41]